MDGLDRCSNHARGVLVMNEMTRIKIVFGLQNPVWLHGNDHHMHTRTMMGCPIPFGSLSEDLFCKAQQQFRQPCRSNRESESIGTSSMQIGKCTRGHKDVHTQVIGHISQAEGSRMVTLPVRRRLCRVGSSWEFLCRVGSSWEFSHVQICGTQQRSCEDRCVSA